MAGPGVGRTGERVAQIDPGVVTAGPRIGCSFAVGHKGDPVAEKGRRKLGGRRIERHRRHFDLPVLAQPGLPLFDRFEQRFPPGVGRRLPEKGLCPNAGVGGFVVGEQHPGVLILHLRVDDGPGSGSGIPGFGFVELAGQPVAIGQAALGQIVVGSGQGFFVVIDRMVIFQSIVGRVALLQVVDRTGSEEEANGQQYDSGDRSFHLARVLADKRP